MTLCCPTMDCDLISQRTGDLQEIHMWYVNDSVSILLSSKLIHRNPLPCFLLYLLFPSFIPYTFYSLLLLSLLTKVLLTVLRIRTLNWGSKLLWLLNYPLHEEKEWWGGRKRRYPQRGPPVNANKHLLLLLPSPTVVISNKVSVFSLCLTLPHSSSACCETKSTAKYFSG